MEEMRWENLEEKKEKKIEKGELNSI